MLTSVSAMRSSGTSMFILLISNHTVFLVQFGINLHLQVFQKAEIALAKAAHAISAFWKTHSCKLIPNWTRNRMITSTNILIIMAYSKNIFVQSKLILFLLIFSYPLYKAFNPSSFAILTKAWSIPRYLISFCLMSITCPCSCSLVFVVSIGNVPVRTQQQLFSKLPHIVQFNNKNNLLPQLLLYILVWLNYQMYIKNLANKIWIQNCQFFRGRKTREPRERLSKQNKNQQYTQSTRDSGIQTQVTVKKGECSHNCTNPFPLCVRERQYCQLSFCNVKLSDTTKTRKY